MKTIIYKLAAIFLCLTAYGCSSNSISGYPSKANDASISITNLDPYFEKTLFNLHSGQSAENERDRYIQITLATIDSNYMNFSQGLIEQNNSTNLGVSLAVLGLSAATSSNAIASAASKSKAAALSSMLIGGKAVFDKTVLFDKAIPALILKMNANRKTILHKILSGMDKTIKEYPLILAKNHLDDYYSAGTIPGAINGITELAGIELKEATDKVDSKIINLSDDINHQETPLGCVRHVVAETDDGAKKLHDWAKDNTEKLAEQGLTYPSYTFDADIWNYPELIQAFVSEKDIKCSENR